MTQLVDPVATGEVTTPPRRRAHRDLRAHPQQAADVGAPTVTASVLQQPSAGLSTGASAKTL